MLPPRLPQYRAHTCLIWLHRSFALSLLSVGPTTMKEDDCLGFTSALHLWLRLYAGRAEKRMNGLHCAARRVLGPDKIASSPVPHPTSMAPLAVHRVKLNDWCHKAHKQWRLSPIPVSVKQMQTRYFWFSGFASMCPILYLLWRPPRWQRKWPNINLKCSLFFQREVTSRIHYEDLKLTESRTVFPDLILICGFVCDSHATSVQTFITTRQLLDTIDISCLIFKQPKVEPGERSILVLARLVGAWINV